jgi:hypothetical protein
MHVRSMLPRCAGCCTNYLPLQQRTQLWEYDSVREEYEACVEGLGAELIEKVIFSL